MIRDLNGVYKECCEGDMVECMDDRVSPASCGRFPGPARFWEDNNLCCRASERGAGQLAGLTPSGHRDSISSGTC